MLLGGEHGGAVGHLAVRERGSVLDGEHPLAPDLLRVALDQERRCGEDDLRGGSVLADRIEDRIDSLLRRSVHLVDDAYVRHAEIRLAGVVAKLVTGAVRVDDDDVDVRLDERRVVVAAVPENDVCLPLGEAENLLVIDPGEDEVPLGEVRLVLLPLFDRGVGGVEVFVALESLHGLLRQVAVGHRVPEHGNALPRLAQQLRDPAGRLALPRTGADGADRDNRLRRSQHCQLRGEQPVRRARSERA